MRAASKMQPRLCDVGIVCVANTWRVCLQDFTYATDGSSQDGATAEIPASPIGPGADPTKLPQAWVITGGSGSTYAKWGGYVPTSAKVTSCVGTGCGPSLVYLGNGWDGKYYLKSGNSDLNAAAIFSSTRYAQIPDLIPTPQDGYGTSDTPFSYAQTLALKVGARYRLQWWASSEDSSMPTPNFGAAGISGLDITGYTRTYYTVLHTANYMAVDFIAKEVQVCKFSPCTDMHTYIHVTPVARLAVSEHDSWSCRACGLTPWLRLPPCLACNGSHTVANLALRASVQL